MKNKIKEMLKKMLETLGAITTDEGVTLNYEGDTLEVGVEVTDDNGEPVADGEYTFEGKVYSVAEGKVAEVKDSEPSTDEEEKPAEADKDVEAEDDKPEEEKPAEEAENGESGDVEEEDADAADEVDALKAEIESLMAEIDALKAEIESLKAEPAADTIVEEFEKHTNNNKKDKQAKAIAFAEATK